MSRAWAQGCLVVLLVLGAILFRPGSSLAANGSKPQPMQFTLILGTVGSCQPGCPRWIYAAGDIKADSAAKFQKFLSKLKGKKYPIMLTSRGGDVDAALAMGRIIRKAGLPVIVGHTYFWKCRSTDTHCIVAAPDMQVGVVDGAGYCLSACPYILSGGVERRAFLYSDIGVHQITTTFYRTLTQYKERYIIKKGKKVIISRKVVSRKTSKSGTSTKLSPALSKKLKAYLKTMGVDDQMLTVAQTATPDSMAFLQPGQRLGFRLLTSTIDPIGFDYPTVCVTNVKREACPVEEVLTDPTSDPMQFRVVQGMPDLCKPDCPQWIYVHGDMMPGTGARFANFLDSLVGGPYPIILDSRGGDVVSAIAIARMIRSHGMSVVVGRTRFNDCLTPYSGCVRGSDSTAVGYREGNGACNSTCTLLLAGGVVRLVDPQSTVALHRLKRELGSKLQPYLTSMGIADEVLGLLQDSPSKELHQMDKSRMLTMRLITGDQGSESLTFPTVCVDKPDRSPCPQQVGQ